MLPTSPRSSVRSRCTSCTAPCSTTATRVSWGAQLIKMSWLMGIVCLEFCVLAVSDQPHTGRTEHLRRLVRRQAHDARITATDVAGPKRRVALDRVGAGLAHGFTAVDVAAYLSRRQGCKIDP